MEDNFMEVIDIIREYDVKDRKGFDFYEICELLNKSSDTVKQSKEFRFESVCFNLTPSVDKSEWGTYFGPKFHGRTDDGKTFSYPSLSDVTEEAVSYWYKRSCEVVNPYLKARYSGLVWDFMKKVSAKSYPSDLYNNYIDSLLAVVSGEYPSHPVITVNISNRLFDLGCKNNKYLGKIKDVLSAFDIKYDMDDKSPRLWGMYLLLIINNKKFFTQDEAKNVIERHEKRLERLYNGLNKDKSLFWTLKEQVTLLAEYYAKYNQQNECKRVLNCLESALSIVDSTMSNMQKAGNLEMVARLYSKFNLHSEYKRLLGQIEKSSKVAAKEMQTSKFEFTYPIEALMQLKDFIVQGDTIEQIQRFCLYFVLDKKEQENNLKEMAVKFPLQYLIPTQLEDEKGRPLSQVGGIEDDFEGQLVMYICQNINLQSLPLNFIIKALVENQVFSIANIMKMVEDSPIIVDDRYFVIEEALTFFFKENYLVFCHLIVPQIESFFRELLDKSGKPVIKPQNNSKSQGYTLRILDDILRDEVISSTFNENIAYYFRIVLTDQRGWNVRNALCHGLQSPYNYNQTVANRLFHIFMLLLLIK